MLYLECCYLRIINMDPREKKWREVPKFIWNMVLEKNVINKMDS
jgi:hypothetical protein